jgi:hypothetical protein
MTVTVTDLQVRQLLSTNQLCIRSGIIVNMRRYGLHSRVAK